MSNWILLKGRAYLLLSDWLSLFVTSPGSAGEQLCARLCWTETSGIQRTGDVMCLLTVLEIMCCLNLLSEVRQHAWYNLTWYSLNFIVSFHWNSSSVLRQFCSRRLHTRPWRDTVGKSSIFIIYLYPNMFSFKVLYVRFMWTWWQKVIMKLAKREYIIQMLTGCRICFYRNPRWNHTLALERAFQMFVCVCVFFFCFFSGSHREGWDEW